MTLTCGSLTEVAAPKLARLRLRMCDGGDYRAALPMKSFLNLVGMLALLGGILALLMAASAVHGILAGISILVCVTSLSLAKVIALAETRLERTSEQRRKAQEHWEVDLDAARADGVFVAAVAGH